MIFGRRKDASEQRDRIIAYKRVFGTPEGKEVLFDILNRCHVLNSHGGDAYKEGQRSVALQIMNNCAINLVELDKLIKGEDLNESA
jgi:hypothetical protein